MILLDREITREVLEEDKLKDSQEFQMGLSKTLMDTQTLRDVSQSLVQQLSAVDSVHFFFSLILTSLRIHG